MAGYIHSVSRGGVLVVVFSLIVGTAHFCQGQNVTVILDGYTPTSTLDSNTTLQLGTTLILICRTGGIPHGTDLTYTWTCPNGPCDVGQGRNTNRKTYRDRLLVNILSTSDAGTYTCQVGLSTTSQVQGADQFVLGVEGGIVLHSGTNLIPHNDFITDVQHITSDTSNTTITIQCTSDQIPLWRGPEGQTLSTATNNTLHQTINGTTSILVLDTSNLNNFTNGRFSCNTTQHTANVNLYIGPGGSLDIPRVFGAFQNGTLIISPAEDALDQFDRFIVSYQRQDLNVPLNVEYQEVVDSGVNTQIAKDLPIPGVDYMVTIWFARDYQYSPNPTLFSPTILTYGQAPSEPRHLTVTRIFTDGFEINWIPPQQSNGSVLYELNYGTNTTVFSTVVTASDDTYYNLTGLQQNITYYIRVVAVNYMTLSGVVRTEGEWITATTLEQTTAIPATSTPTPTDTSTTVTPATSTPILTDTSTTVTPATSTPTPTDTSSPLTIEIAVGASAGVLLIIVILLLIAVITCVVCRRRSQAKKQPTPVYHYITGPEDKDRLDEEKGHEANSNAVYSTVDTRGSKDSNSSSSMPDVVFTNKHAANDGIEEQFEPRVSGIPPGYASLDEVKDEPQQKGIKINHEYENVDTGPDKTSSTPTAPYDETEKATLNEAGYSTVGPLIGDKREGMMQGDEKNPPSDVDGGKTNTSVEVDGYETVHEDPPVDVDGYETVKNDQRGPCQPASSEYDTIDAKVGSSSKEKEHSPNKEKDPSKTDAREDPLADVDGYETVREDPPVEVDSYETVQNDRNGPDQPISSEYETIDVKAGSPSKEKELSSDKQKDPPETDELYTQPVKPSGLDNGTSTEEPQDRQPDPNSLYTEPDKSKKRNKNKEDVPQNSQPDPNSLYTEPDKSKKRNKNKEDVPQDSHPDPSGDEEECLYAEPDNPKKKSDDSEEDIPSEDTPLVPTFDPEILYTLPEKKGKTEVAP